MRIQGVTGFHVLNVDIIGDIRCVFGRASFHVLNVDIIGDIRCVFGRAEISMC